jgi:hypothetical protein
VNGRTPLLVDPVTGDARLGASTSGREAARVVKFSPEGSGRDLLVFSEVSHSFFSLFLLLLFLFLPRLVSLDPPLPSDTLDPTLPSAPLLSFPFGCFMKTQITLEQETD